MNFQIESGFDQVSNHWKVTLVGEVDIYNSAELKSRLNQLIEEKPADMYVDCSKLEYIDSTGLGALVGVLKRVKGSNRTMHLSSVKPNILKLFRITNLDKVFVIEDGVSHE